MEKSKQRMSYIDQLRRTRRRGEYTKKEEAKESLETVERRKLERHKKIHVR